MAAEIGNNSNLIKMKRSKVDAETIAEGEQISGDVDKRLRSSSGKTYHAGITVQTENTKNQMGSIQEVMEAGGIEHAEHAGSYNGSTESLTEEKTDQNMSTQQGINQIIDMVKNLQSTVNEMNQKVTESGVFQHKTEERLQALENFQVSEKREISHLNDCLQQYQLKMDILSDIVIKQQQEITELKSQMIDSQARGMKYNISIAGIPESENENCVKAVNQFLVDKLRIQDRMIPIDQAYRYGSGRIRPMLVTLKNLTDKAYIFSKVGNLKSMKTDGVQCFVANQLPEALNEKRRKINECMAENKKKHRAEKLPYTVKQGELLFANKPIKQRVKPPSARDMLQIHDEETEALNSLKITDGLLEESEGSVFRGYAASATDFDEVDRLYKKMKLMHGQATHIACAYQFEKVKPPYKSGGCDDGEYGAQRALMQTIKDNGVQNIVVFMVRYYGGKKLGPARFDLMRKTVSSAITLWQVSLRESYPEGDDPWNQDLQGQDNEDERSSTTEF